jgi:4,5-dihydroxyphthalate decarboxylase
MKERAMPLTLSFACGRYDRTDPVLSGEVPVEGVELVGLTLSPAETFWRLTQSAEFDVAEMSLSGFIMRVARGDDSYVGLPVFTSRVFRHSGIVVRREVTDARELVGARVAVPEYHMTAVLFMRGLLGDEYGIKPSDITWVQAGQYTPGRIEREPLDLPADIRLEVDREHTVDELLAGGEVRAALSPYPSRLLGGEVIRRLYERPREAELDYYRRTGVYPIMHLLVLRRALYERHPWVATSLMKAFTEAKELCLARMAGVGGHPPVALPFFLHHLEEAREVFGADLWPYGLAANHTTLATACRYSYEQGLSGRVVDPAELFAPNTLLSTFRD